jgi:outer membrane protein insertion porin family
LLLHRPLLLLCTLGTAGALLGQSDSEQIRSVRISGSSAQIELNTRAGDPIDPGVIRADVKNLWGTGRFSDVRVERVDSAEGPDLVFHVAEKPVWYVREVRVRGAAGLNPRIEPGTAIDGLAVHQAEQALERSLVQDGHRDPRVKARIVPVAFRQADLFLDVESGSRSTIDRVRFTGDVRISPGDVERALQATRPRTIIPRLWRARPAYSEQALETDLVRVRALYARRGYLDAQVSLAEISFRGSRAAIEYRVTAGTRYEVGPVTFQGIPEAGFSEPGGICGCLARARRRAESEGRMDFEVRVKATPAPSRADLRPRVDFHVTVNTGEAYRLGRIDFRGHHAYSDPTIRRVMTMDEGELFNWSELHGSLARIDRLNLFEPLTPEAVAVQQNPHTHTANITISLKERPRGTWNLSGPVGPPSIGGPLQVSISSRLPKWGPGIFEASTYYATVSLTGFTSPLLSLIPFAPRPFEPYIRVARPFLAGQEWLSGLTISPQLGWQASALSYGATQARHRLGLTARDRRRAEAPLLIAIERTGSPDSVWLCEPPTTRLARLRTVAGLALDWLLPGFGL